MKTPAMGPCVDTVVYVGLVVVSLVAGTQSEDPVMRFAPQTEYQYGYTGHAHMPQVGVFTVTAKVGEC